MEIPSPHDAIRLYHDFIRKNARKLSAKYRDIIDEGGVEDIVQIVCVKILQGGLEKWKGISSIEGYIYTIIKNSITNYFRETKKSHVEFSEHIIDAAIWSNDANRDGIDRHDFYEAINAYLADEKPKRAAIFRLHFEGMPQIEIAAKLHLSPATVSEHIATVRQGLAASLKQRFPGIENLDMEFYDGTRH